MARVRRHVRCGAPWGCGEHGVGKEPGAGSPVHTRRWQKRLDANEPGTSVQMSIGLCVFKCWVFIQYNNVSALLSRASQTPVRASASFLRLDFQHYKYLYLLELTYLGRRCTYTVCTYLYLLTLITCRCVGAPACRVFSLIT